MPLTATNFEDLANAIIVMAAEDYKVAYRQANVLSVGKSSQRECRELERVFRSDWYKKLTTVDGEYLIKILRKQALEECL
jgi:hypothetical protein